ncbi:MAG TPA: hypothetical protein VKB04_05730, partial [Anaerolineales bacterium]|nr:hypothetical protein [Anaerolineales bacterium]
MITKLIKSMSVLAIILFVGNPALAAGNPIQTIGIPSGLVSAAKSGTYTNPLSVQIPNDGRV